MDPEISPGEAGVPDRESAFLAALREGRHDEAREVAERGVADPDVREWEVAEMLELLGRSLADGGRFDESIAAFERAIELGWNAVPDGRCEIARVLLEAGRHEEADALWRELWADDPEEQWTLNSAGLSYADVGRDEEAVAWLGEGIRVALAAGDPLRILEQMSDARRASLRRLGREPDALEHQVESFRAGRSAGETARIEDDGAPGRPATPGSVEVTWLREEDDLEARRRWPMWSAGLAVEEPFADRAARMERFLRGRRAEGHGPIVLVTLDLEHFAGWCEENGYDPGDRRSRGTYMQADERHSLSERRWPPGRNETCWCGSGRKYKRCCGAAPNEGDAGAAL